MLYAVIALCLFGGASAQLFGWLNCPTAVSPMAHFDAKRLNGRWYKVRKFPMVYTWLSHCPHVEFESAGPSSIKIVHSTFYSKQRIHLKFGGVAGPLGSDRSGHLQNTLIFERWKVDYQVLDTDYNNYVVIYSCTNLILFHIQFLFIYTKEPNPSLSTINTALNVLEYNRIPTTYLQTVIRDNCTKVDTA